MTNLADQISQQRPTRRSGPTPMDLSSREEQILVLISQCCTNREIADTLFIGINTVKTHIRSVYKKIGVNSRPRAIIWAVNHDYLSRVQTTD